MSKKETWKPVVGFEGLYEVSDLGRVRSLDRIIRQWNRHAWIERRYPGVVLKPRPRNKFYAAYILYNGNIKRTVNGHVLVAESFVGPRPRGLEVCHDNGVHDDNRLCNLRYDTHKSNSGDTTKHGRQVRPQGEKHGMSRFSNEDVVLMRKYSAAGLTGASIAVMFDASPTAVSQIVRRKRWTHI